jgi:hypothetical protein
VFFQTLDDKSECVGIYVDNKLIFDPAEFPNGLTQTWKYVPYLRGLDVEYVSLYLEGKSISEALPEYLQDDWDDIAQKIKAFKRSLRISQVNVYENCFFDLIPHRFLMELCAVKNKITQYVFDHVDRPERYEFHKHIAMMLEDLAQQPVKINRGRVSSYLQSPKLKNQAKAILACDPFVKYNQFGTKTGRLTTQKGSFPILTLGKEFRSAIAPCNDYFLELDFNGAEVRTLLGLLGSEQPGDDVHDFHLREIFTDITSRDQAKVAFFAWLYGSRTAANSPAMAKLASFYQKDKLLEKYWDGSTVTTPFRKQIPHTSRHHALNYLVQSTAAELTLKQALKVEYLLRHHSSGSRIAFLIHDAIIIDMKKEDENLLKSMVSLMSSTNFGQFRVNIKRGETLGTLKDLPHG